MTEQEQLVHEHYKKLDQVPENLRVLDGDWAKTDKHIFRFGKKGPNRYISAISIASHNRELKRLQHV